jgi:murein DD-endopeptidase MepM/ murein hydrolase activator NlpD
MLFGDGAGPLLTKPLDTAVLLPPVSPFLRANRDVLPLLHPDFSRQGAIPSFSMRAPARYDVLYGIREPVAPLSRYGIGYDVAYGIRKSPDQRLRDALLLAARESLPGKRSLPTGNPQDIGGVLQWKPLLEEAERKFGVPWQVLGAIMAIESGGNPKARSPQGAVGLMQVMPNYHAGRAAKYGGDLWDPRVNVFTAADFLAELYRRYGSWEKAAAAYFGAIDARGNITGARDALGTTGYQYVEKFRNTLAKLHNLGQPSGMVKVGSAWSIFGGQRFPITQEYGNYNPSMYRSGYHTGIDIGAPSGTRLFSPFRGVVVQAGWNGGYGNSVTIRLDDGKILLLGHLSAVAVRPGQRVDAGTFLGLSGNTGYSTGPHVHLEMRDASGKIIDPRNYLVF